MTAGKVTLTSDPVGKSVPRIDIHEKLTGAAVFADDMQFGPGMYYGRLVRSPHAHALVKRVDVSKALEMPGVKAVVTGQDVSARIGLYLIDRPIFATDRVRHVGDAVAEPCAPLADEVLVLDEFSTWQAVDAA